MKQPHSGTKSNHSILDTAYRDWFAEKGWSPFDFQEDVWQAIAAGESGLLHAPTGMGKTLAVWFGLLERCGPDPRPNRLKVLWITPLRALSADTALALSEPVEEMNLPWTIDIRTGDTPSSKKTRQVKKPPHLMITTPESLSLLISLKDSGRLFSGLEAIVIDEWHELFGSKRGVQTELALAHLKELHPNLMIWGMSATLANLETARHHLHGHLADGRITPGRIIRGCVPKTVRIDALLPPSADRFPWAGHLGLKMVPQVIDELESTASALIFTNTRSQAELWYRAICEARPDWADTVGIHHGSIDREDRLAVEQGLKTGTLRCVVCTSSLDLGVDFSPVDRVFQVGSPKGAARLLQRAGRSGHDPDRSSRITIVPTHALELLEAAAVRDAIDAGKIEARLPITIALDVLSQHLVTLAAGPGFEPARLLASVRRTAAFHDLSDAEWEWTLDFVTRGGETLRAYPDYQRIVDDAGIYRIKDDPTARRHRMGIGTITSDDAAVVVKYQKGGRIGTVEESFANRLKKGDRFQFAGKTLEVIRIRDMTIYVRKGKGKPGAVPVWLGGRMPLSTELAAAVEKRLESAGGNILDTPEMAHLKSLFALQARWSAIPKPGELLVESLATRQGHHLFLYPFAGRLVHEGLAALLSWRLSQQRPQTFTWSVNDYGMELLSAKAFDLPDGFEKDLFAVDHLVEEIFAAINAAEMSKTAFRGIARIAGLVFSGYPGRGKSTRQVQTSSGLLFNVFERYDRDNRFLVQARREVMERQLEIRRLSRTLHRLSAARIRLARPPRPTPLGFPLMVDRMRQTMSSETLAERVQRMTVELEKAAG